LYLAIAVQNLKSNLSAFISYEDVDNLSNWAWNNSFSYTLWKKIGVGFDFGLRSNKQEAFNFALAQNPTATGITLDNVDNDLQTFWTLGLSYNFVYSNNKCPVRVIFLRIESLTI